MTKPGKDPSKLFDVRLVERNINRGLMTRKDLHRHLDALPDVASKSMTLAQAEADRLARMPPPPPPPATPAPIVRAYAPPAQPSVLDGDDLDDDDLDDDLDDGLGDETDDQAVDEGDDLGDDDDGDLGSDDDDPDAPLA